MNITTIGLDIAKNVHWAEGECWYADFGQPHSFANRGDTGRVHMVLDCKLDDWLLKLLKAPADDI